MRGKNGLPLTSSRRSAADLDLINGGEWRTSRRGRRWGKVSPVGGEKADAKEIEIVKHTINAIRMRMDSLL